MISASGPDGKAYRVHIVSTDNPARYRFSIEKVARGNTDYRLKIMANGKPVGIKHTQEKEVLIPAKGSFRFLSAHRIEEPENGIEIIFSDPVSSTQDLKGLVEIPEISSSILQVENNKIILFFEANHRDKLSLKIDEGLRNFDNRALGTSHSVSFGQLNLRPQVKLSTSAAILPDSKNLIIPFRAVNLHAVDLSVIRIFENNVLTFMQTNSLSSANELRRSGRLVYKKTLWLSKDPSKDVRRWEDYSIDLAGDRKSVV